MSLNFNIKQSSQVVFIEGTAEDLDTIEYTLQQALMQHSFKGAIFRTWVRRTAYHLDVLLGSAIAAGVLPHATDMVDIVESVATAVATLHSEGLLWEHQAFATCAGLLAPYGRGILAVPTGGGKTRICVACVAVGAKVLGIDSWVYLAPNQGLVEQTEGAFDELLESMCNLIGTNPPRITCCTYGAASKNIDGCGGLLVDEVHGAAAPTRAKVLMSCAATWRVGLSATPLLRQDARNTLVIGLLGPVCYEIGLRALEEAGCIARGKVTRLIL